MEILSFTGKSGTGKSYQATRLAKELGVDAMIDDGLLIYKNSVVAGQSAKRCTSRAKAMRTALFDYEDQRKEVHDQLKRLNPDKLMILGTSDRMANWIADSLELPHPTRRIYIEDITTEEERATAKHSRLVDGEHVIPAPMGQLRRDFAGYFMHPQRFIRNMRLNPGMEGEEERTVVRPQFSYYGKFTISESVIWDIVRIAALNYSRALCVTDYYHSNNTQNLDVEIQVIVRNRNDIVALCRDFQEDCREMIEQMTAFHIRRINLRVKDMMLDRELEESKRLRMTFRRRKPVPVAHSLEGQRDHIFKPGVRAEVKNRGSMADARKRSYSKAGSRRKEIYKKNKK